MVTEFANATVETRANVYFDGRCVSHTLHLPDGSRKTIGVIFPASLTFGTAAPERMQLQSGACRIKRAGSEVWESYSAGDSFEVPGDSSFEIEVTQTVDYICHYG